MSAEKLGGKSAAWWCRGSGTVQSLYMTSRRPAASSSRHQRLRSVHQAKAQWFLRRSTRRTLATSVASYCPPKTITADRLKLLSVVVVMVVLVVGCPLSQHLKLEICRGFSTGHRRFVVARPHCTALCHRVLTRAAVVWICLPAWLAGHHWQFRYQAC